MSLKKKKTFLIKNLSAYEINWINGIDIDTHEDLKLSKILSKIKKI